MSREKGEREQRFLEIYDEYYDRLFSYVLRGVHHRETAEDLTANAFFKALRYFKEKDDVRCLKAWLYKIATNEILMHHRFHRNKVFINCETEEFQSFLLLNERKLPAGDRELDILALRQALEKLKPGEKAVIEMHYFESLGFEEMSAILGKKESTLRSILHRTLKKLNRLLTGDNA